jgi:hypothetical protein
MDTFPLAVGLIFWGLLFLFAGIILIINARRK